MNEIDGKLTTAAAEGAVLSACLAALAAIAGYYLFRPFGREAVGLAMAYGALAAAGAAAPVALLALSRYRWLLADNRRLASAATTDRLTSVLNRGAFVAKVQRELRQIEAQYSEYTAYALLIVDADHFKRINDQLGHPVGDAALRAISNVIRRSVRGTDLVGRLGGEEFAVFLRGTDRASAAVVAERLRRNVEAVTIGEGRGARRLSVSIGGIAFATGESFDRLYEIADANLYRAKSGGRNRVELHALAEPARQIENREAHRRLMPGRA